MTSCKNRKMSKNKKGGFLFGKSKVVSSSECDVNNLSTLTKIPDVNDMNGEMKPQDERMDDLDNMTSKLRENYNKCCPKGFMGKNTSPYCKQLDGTFRSIEQHKQDIAGYYGDKTNVEEIKKIMNPSSQDTKPKKPWYSFSRGRGGKKTRKHRKHRKNKKTSHIIG